MRLLLLAATMLSLAISSQAQDILSYKDSEITLDFVDMNDALPTEIIAVAGEDEVYPLPLPFAFEYFGVAYNNIFASINGNISFSESYQGRDFNREHLCYPVNTLYNPAGGENSANPDNFIAVHWADLFLESTCMPGDGGMPKLAYRTVGDAPNRVFIVTWDYFVMSGDLLPCANIAPDYGGYVKAQVKLFEGTNNIEIHLPYNRLSAQEATIGVENIDGSYANYVKCGQNQDQFENIAWRFTPSEDEDPGNEKPEEGGYCKATGDFCGDTYGTIGEFTFGSVTTNNRGCQGSLTPEDKAYADNTDIVLNYEIGTPVAFSGIIADDLLFTDQVALWIDWNQDTVFAADELTIATVVQDAFSGTVEDPLGEFKPGLTRLRIRSYNPANCYETPDPCGETCGNEVEDYSILVTDPAQPFPDCPQAFLPSDGQRDLCVDTEFAWNKPANVEPDSFRIKAFTSNATLFTAFTTDTFYVPANTLPANETINWLIDAYAGGLVSNSCDTLSFTTGNELPVIEILPLGGQISLCEDGSVQLGVNVTGGNAPFGYTWSGPAASKLDDASSATPIYTPLAAGTEAIELSMVDDFGCESNTDQSSLVTDQAVVAASINPVSAEICEGDDFEFSLSGGTGGDIFQLSFDGGMNWEDTVPTQSAGNLVFAEPSDEFLLRTVVDGGICKDTSAVFVLKINPVPAAPVFSHGLQLSFCTGDSVILEVSNYSTGIVWDDAKGTADPKLVVKSKGDYTATYTDANTGCFAQSQTVEVTTRPIPAFKAVQAINNDPACEGIGVVLFVNSSDEVLWNGPETGNTDTLTVFTSGTYQATMRNEFFCETLSDEIEVDFNPSPAKPVIVESNDTLYTSNTSDSYRWFVDGSEISGETRSFLPISGSGVYSVIAVASTGCESPLSDDYSVVVGISELDKYGIKVFPNPSRGDVNLVGVQKVGSIQLLTATGILLESYDGSVDKIQIKDSGVYILKLNLIDEKVIYTRVVIQ